MLIIIIIYLITMVAVGFYLSKRVKEASDFLIAGRKLGLLLSIATLAAVQVGAGVAELKAWATAKWDKMSEILGKLSE